MRKGVSRLGLLAATGALLVGLPMCARDSGAPPGSNPGDRSGEETAPDDTDVRAALASTPLGQVVSRDERGAARFIVGAVEDSPATLNASSETAARVHLSRHAELLGVSESAIRTMTQIDTQKLEGGASVVRFEQRVNGIEIFRARASVVLDPSKNLVSIGANLHPRAAATHAAKAMPFRKTAESVVADVYAGHFGYALPEKSVNDTGARGGDFRGYDLATPQGAPAVLDAAAKKVFFPQGDGLVAAYYVEMAARASGSNENESYSYVIAADDGRVLYEASLTASDSFKYRVWADPSGVPADGPYVDYSPHPTGFPNGVLPGYAQPILISQEGFNKNPNGQADPWLPPNATTTFGNNVRAYGDRNDNHAGSGDGFDPGDVVPDVTAPKTFDRIYDVNKEPNASPDQIKAAATQLFYVNNWLHDYFYDSGFNEAAGVAQLSNFGRGGAEGDPLRAEAQDGADSGFSNNANMSTPSDGISPRMQMFVWSGVPNRSFQTTPAGAYTDPFGAAAFGPQQFEITGDLVVSSPADACAVPTNVAGKIAVIDRGTCPFTDKGKNAQAAGAIGIVLVNNAAGHSAPNPGLPDASITIPLIGLSLEDGAIVKSALARGPVSARLKRGAETLHDGTIDNTVIAHEWGHYIHHRLVSCGSASCSGMSEGWGDFVSLFMVVRESDLDNELFGAAFPMAQYAAAGITNSAAYFGIRRAPYSANRAKNPFTFRHIRRSSPLPTGAPLSPASPDNAEVHNVGEIWTQTLFEGYVNVLHAGQVAGRSFDQSKRRMADYIVAGMKAAPPEPTFTEQRDAILSTVWAMGQKDDFFALARGFAKRGLGSGAIAPPTSSTSFDEAVENFDMRGKLTIVDAKLDDSISSCDDDGVLDAGETGKLTVRVRNLGWQNLRSSKLNVSTTDPSVTFTNNGQATIRSIDPYGIATVTVTVAADQIPLSRAELPITIELRNDEAVPAVTSTVVNTLFNYDDVPNSSPIDNVESARPAWTIDHGSPRPANVWLRQGDASNHVWHAHDLGVTSDERLVSPNLVVGNGDFKITFKHRYQFETTPGAPATYWDGGVLEITTDNGATWNDIATYKDPGYPQTLIAGGENPLQGRKAWAGDSPGYPAYTTVSVNLGKQLQGKTIKVRFRAGADESGGHTGWDIDNLIFSGLTNLPFPSIVDDRTTCEAELAKAK
ncbi:M36 family metallopeptidase [Pendulispora albinea]|uniref:M36 family metallopeptidase n=1 Tax=Pendulispora albinea TaxID=2741071 RepID=A0ABZ2M555_9BACT